jgi:hypothetical protein
MGTCELVRDDEINSDRQPRKKIKLSAPSKTHEGAATRKIKSPLKALPPARGVEKVEFMN